MSSQVQSLSKRDGGLCCIEKRVISHLARHTFTTTVAYANGVLIKSISKMFGHMKISATQIYARIIDKTVSDEKDKLAQRLGNMKFSMGEKIYSVKKQRDF